MTTTKRLYIGSDSGLTVLTGDGAAWLPYREVLAGKFVRAMSAVRGVNQAYACVTQDGLYASRDGGESWQLVLPGNVHSVAVDPSDSNIVYAGTEPVGLYRSNDGGQHWSELTALRDQPENVTEKWWFPQFPHESHVLSIFVDWHDPRVLCVGLEHGGILRSSDGGASWEDISAGIEYVDIHTVKGDPLQANLYYTATARGFYRSERYWPRLVVCRAWYRSQLLSRSGGDSGKSTGFILDHCQRHAAGLAAQGKSAVGDFPQPGSRRQLAATHRRTAGEHGTDDLESVGGWR